jgi:hypothetical protein
MADTQELTERMFALSRAYRKVAGDVLDRAHMLRQLGQIDDAAFASVKTAYRRIIASASDMLTDLDDALAAELDVPLKSVEAATSRLKAAQARIEQAGAIVDISIKVAGAAGAVAIFVAAPNMASAQAAAGAIAAATGALP